MSPAPIRLAYRQCQLRYGFLFNITSGAPLIVGVSGRLTWRHACDACVRALHALPCRASCSGAPPRLISLAVATRAGKGGGIRVHVRRSAELCGAGPAWL